MILVWLRVLHLVIPQSELLFSGTLSFVITNVSSLMWCSFSSAVVDWKKVVASVLGDLNTFSSSSISAGGDLASLLIELTESNTQIPH